MKIGILTFHAAFNYGSMLQAWALQTALSDLGHDVKVINFQTPKQKRMYRKPFASLKPVYLLGDLNKLRKSGREYIQRRSRWDKFHIFLHNFMRLTEEYDVESWCKVDKDFDLIITGSDQIWNLYAYDFEDVYLGKGVASDIRLVAYAPSMGPSPEKNDVGTMKHYLKRYSDISTREEGAKNYLLTNNICASVDKVLDPTMLLEFERYRSFIRDDKSFNDSYAYSYTPGNHPKILAKAVEICNRLQLPLKVDSGFFHTKGSGYISMITDGGPCEFLSYIHHSKIVVGASFHLIVFAILMHKDFFCINGDVDERMHNLLSMFGLEHRVISLEKELPENIDSIDWAEVDKKLEVLRRKSYQYLKKAISI